MSAAAVTSTPLVSAAYAGPASTGTPAPEAEHGFLSDLLDIINPLQHLPVISTIYRAVTGESIGDVERVAGDTLYGGLAGLGSSLLNIGFRELTGKDIGDTVLAYAQDVTGLNLTGGTPAGSAVAAVPVAVEPAQGLTGPQIPDMSALLSALNGGYSDVGIAARVAAAYGKSQALAQP